MEPRPASVLGEPGEVTHLHQAANWRAGYPGSGYPATSGGWSPGAPPVAGVYPMPYTAGGAYPAHMAQPVRTRHPTC